MKVWTVLNGQISGRMSPVLIDPATGKLVRCHADDAGSPARKREAKQAVRRARRRQDDSITSAEFNKARDEEDLAIYGWDQ